MSRRSSFSSSLSDVVSFRAPLSLSADEQGLRRSSRIASRVSASSVSGQVSAQPTYDVTASSVSSTADTVSQVRTSVMNTLSSASRSLSSFFTQAKTKLKQPFVSTPAQPPSSQLQVPVSVHATSTAGDKEVGRSHRYTSEWLQSSDTSVASRHDLADDLEERRSIGRTSVTSADARGQQVARSADEFHSADDARVTAMTSRQSPPADQPRRRKQRRLSSSSSQEEIDEVVEYDRVSVASSRRSKKSAASQRSETMELVVRLQEANMRQQEAVIRQQEFLTKMAAEERADSAKHTETLLRLVMEQQRITSAPPISAPPTSSIASLPPIASIVAEVVEQVKQHQASEFQQVMKGVQQLTKEVRSIVTTANQQDRSAADVIPVTRAARKNDTSSTSTSAVTVDNLSSGSISAVPDLQSLLRSIQPPSLVIDGQGKPDVSPAIVTTSQVILGSIGVSMVTPSYVTTVGMMPSTSTVYATDVKTALQPQQAKPTVSLVSPAATEVTSSVITGAVATPGLSSTGGGAPQVFTSRRKERKVGEFNGDGDVESYLRQFDLIARANGWNDIDKAIDLSASLRGVARQTLLSAPDATELSYTALCARLRESFGPVQHSMYHATALEAISRKPKETVHQIVDRLRPLGQLAYPRVSDVTQRKELLTRHFIAALTNSEQRRFVLRDMPTTLSAAASAAELFETINSVEERRADYVPPQEPKKKVRTVDVSEESELAAQVAELSLQVRALTRTTGNDRQTSTSQERGRARNRNDSERRREQSRSTSKGAVRSVERTSSATSSQPNGNTAKNDNLAAEIKREVDQLKKEVNELKRENANLRQRSASNSGRQQQQTFVKQPASRNNSQTRPPPSGSCYNCGSTDHWRNDCTAPVHQDGVRNNSQSRNTTGNRPGNNQQQGNGRGRGNGAGQANGQ